MRAPWLSALTYLSLVSALVCALLIVYDIFTGRRQKMKIMEWVWPVNALYFGVFGLWAYFRLGRPGAEPAGGKGASRRPFWQTVFIADTHCGAGCTLGDILAEWVVFLAALTIAGASIWPSLILDFVAAFVLGIVFQYLTIAPMRHVSGWSGVKAALKADALSLSAFEVGLFGWMLLTRFVFFRAHPLHPGEPVYWFMMQVGMLLGFATAYPVNWWLLRNGLKERM